MATLVNIFDAFSVYVDVVNKARWCIANPTAAKIIDEIEATRMSLEKKNA